MFQHLLKLIWNKKRQNFLLSAELLISFIVLFVLGTILSNVIWNYRAPKGLDDEDIWKVHIGNGPTFQTKDSLLAFYESVSNSVKSIPKVKSLTLSDFFIPYGDGVNTTIATYKDKSISPINILFVDDHYASTLGLTLLEGRWYDKQDALQKNLPIVISRSLRDAMFGKGEALGKVFDGAGNRRVVGVVEDTKLFGDYTSSGYTMFGNLDTGNADMINVMLIKVSPDADVRTEEMIHKTLYRSFNGADIDIKHLSEMREAKNKQSFVPILIFGIIAGFLVINVALGLVGVLWYNIQQRAPEFGLRRAVGATRSSVSMQLWGEALITASFALVIGTFFAIQFPILHVFNIPTPVYIMALIFAILFIYLLVTLCALFPGRRAASIYPAVVLHED
jgi:putative ABC transport system permease protein